MTPQSSHELTITDVAHYPRPGLSDPRKLSFSPDSRYVNYLANANNSLVQQLWAFDPGTGAHTQLTGLDDATQPGDHTFTREEELRRERSRTRELGITDYAYAAKAVPPVLLVPSGGQLLVKHGDAPFHALPESAGAIAPQLSANGTHVAYVRDGELHVQDTSGGAVLTLTRDAAPGITNGLAEFVAQEEMGRGEGFWWSPDNAISHTSA